MYGKSFWEKDLRRSTDGTRAKAAHGLNLVSCQVCFSRKEERETQNKRAMRTRRGDEKRPPAYYLRKSL